LGKGTEPLRELIVRYYGEDCRILELRRAGGGGAFLMIVEATLRGRPLRMLGTVGRTRELMEHSAMDLGSPERLVFPYERVMLGALALAREPKSVLLLGLGGGAMCRHLEAYVPDAKLTLVERDRTVIALAREHFHIKRKIVQADAEEMVAEYDEAFDAILIDLYDASGAAPLAERFWTDCLAALKPDGCLAINWAGGWSGAGESGTPRQRIARVAPQLPGSFLVAERGPRGNIVQLVPTRAGLGAATLRKDFERFARAHGLPREDRDILERCDVGARYRPPARGRKVAP
jgi:spermidine synthase